MRSHARVPITSFSIWCASRRRAPIFREITEAFAGNTVRAGLKACATRSTWRPGVRSADLQVCPLQHERCDVGPDVVETVAQLVVVVEHVQLDVRPLARPRV